MGKLWKLTQKQIFHFYTADLFMKRSLAKFTLVRVVHVYILKYNCALQEQNLFLQKFELLQYVHKYDTMYLLNSVT